MSKIQIADLQANGTELFQGTESFLTELQSVEAHAIYGGKKTGSNRKNTGGSKIGKSSAGKKGGSKSSSGSMCPPHVDIIVVPPSGD